MKSVSRTSGVILVLAVSSCQSQKPPEVRAENTTATPSKSSITREEPLWERSPEKFREAWMNFTKDGRYRMAQTKEVGGMPYHYGFFQEVLVIVVDETLTGNSRLKLAYFKAPDRDRGTYKLYWVDHNFNLANSYLGNASSVLYIYEGGESATRSAPLKWDATRRAYTARA